MDYYEYEYENLLLESSNQYKVFQVLKDCNWHCRVCYGKNIPSAQIAGGGGIQGLQRGTKSRPGIIIESKHNFCYNCRANTVHDRWTGGFQVTNAPASIPPQLQLRILQIYNYTDAIEERIRSQHELVIDHRLPMIRWGKSEDINNINMSVEDIVRKFQLLKKDEGGNHNLLKSRACERCAKTGKRGFPLGIKYYYYGTEDWPVSVPPYGMGAEIGCTGCGWYDVIKWRSALNKFIQHYIP